MTKIEQLRKLVIAQEQAANNHREWFIALVDELASLLKCKKQANEVIKAVKKTIERADRPR